MPDKRTTAQRGYGTDHRQARAAWEPTVNALRARCVFCKEIIVPDPKVRGNGWDLDHTPDKRAYRGPAHASCNRADGARRRQHPPPAQPRHSRRW